jgi:hypothetical protein
LHKSGRIPAAALSLAEILGEILSSLREEDRETAEAYEGRMILNG